ncbi:MAG: hypothetical protein Q9207_006096, partial [Kuettlingeria erythrocarpa]
MDRDALDSDDGLNMDDDAPNSEYGPNMNDDGRSRKFKDGKKGREKCSKKASRFRWKSKPEPFGQNFPEATYIEDWEEFERKARDELWAQIGAAEFKPIEGDNDDEVTVDQDAKTPKHRFERSQIVKKWMSKIEDFNRKNPRPPEKAIQYVMAEGYVDGYGKLKAKWDKKGKGTKFDIFKDTSGPTKNYKAAVKNLYAKGQPTWSEIEARFDATFVATAAQEKDPESVSLSSVLTELVKKKWSGWLHRFEDANLVYLGKLNDHLVDNSGLLRVIPESSIYIALDENYKILVYLDPSAVHRTFGDETKRRMERDTKDLYDLKPPTRAKNARTTSQVDNEKRNGFKTDECGVDHLGHWHEPGHATWAMFETSETDSVPSYYRQLMLYYLESTGGTLTRLLDYQFGILDPELRAAYRAVYRESPKFAKLPPTNGPRHEETYCLRAYLINMHTDQHKDEGDWKGGLTGIVQLGDFKGIALVPQQSLYRWFNSGLGKGMVFKELGIILPGYQSGAAMQFRGTILKHFIGKWEGSSRYAFDHTTHETVRKAAESLKKKTENGESKIDYDPDAENDDNDDDKKHDQKDNNEDDKKDNVKPKERAQRKSRAAPSPQPNKKAANSKPDAQEDTDHTPKSPTTKRKRTPTPEPDPNDNSEHEGHSLRPALPTRAAKKAKTEEKSAAVAEGS